MATRFLTYVGKDVDGLLAARVIETEEPTKEQACRRAIEILNQRGFYPKRLMKCWDVKKESTK